MTLTTFLFLALGGGLILEGFIWAFFPRQMREMVEQILTQTDDRTLNLFGLGAVMLGLVVVLLVFSVAS